MTEQTQEVMRRAGISHLVAVSGANIGVVLAAVLGPLLLIGVRRRPRLLIAAAVLAGYVWLVGEEPSVQRAATMAAPLLIARCAGVRASPVAALALAAALWSVLDPVTAASVGFLLSVLSTAAILLAAGPLATILADLSAGRLGRTGALVLAVPLVAQLVCTPVLVLLTPEVSLWAVPVNVLVGPLVGPSTVIGLAALVIGSVWPGGAAALYAVAAGGAHLILLIAAAADALPGASIAVPAGPFGAVHVTGVLLAGALALLARRRGAAGWIAAGVLVALLAPGAVRALPVPGERAWTVALCSVGQGDAMLLRAAAGGRESTVLVDTGPDPRALRECLDRAGVRRIDLLVLTHPHADHTGGLAVLTGARSPAEQWVCPLPEALQQALPEVPAAAVTTGSRWRRPGIALQVLWPSSAEDARRASRAETGAGEGDAANDCSIVLEVTWEDGMRLIALGDLEPIAQRRLAETAPGPADLVKVAHHGSRRQDAGLYRELKAGIALVSAGAENPYGHPAADALALIDSSGGRVIRTDQHGTVLLTADDPGAARRVGPPR